MQLQEKQLSDFSPIHVEFCRFSDGSKLNSSPRCCQSFLTDGTKLSIFHERRIIVSCFFLLLMQNIQLKGVLQVLFCPFASFRLMIGRISVK